MKARRLGLLLTLGFALVVALLAVSAGAQAVTRPFGSSISAAAQKVPPAYTAQVNALNIEARDFKHEFPVAMGYTRMGGTMCTQATKLEKDPSTKAAAQTIWKSLTGGLVKELRRSHNEVLDPRLQTMISELSKLRAAFRKYWAQNPKKSVTFEDAIEQARNGVDLWRDAIHQIELGIYGWTDHDCTKAQNAFTQATQIFSQEGSKQVAGGLARLKSLK
jgi:hypothetical protein